MTKRIFNRLLAVALALCLMTSLLNLSAFAADGGADASAISLEAGQTVDLTQQAGTTVYGQELEAPVDPSWSSSDETVATVDQAGVVTGQAAGTVTITREGCAYWVPAEDGSDGVYSFEDVTEGAQCVQATTTWTVEVTAAAPETPEYPEETSTVDYSVRQSESVSYDGYEEKDGVYVFHYTIHDGAQGDLVIDLAQAALAMWNNETQMPGDTFKFQIFVKNESGHSYRYQDGSFVLAPEDTSLFGSIEEGSLLPVLTYDGQLMPIRFSGSMLPKYFYKDVFHVEEDVDVTFEMLCQIYDYLDKAGYSGENAITDYLLDYFNEKYTSDYSSLTQMFADHPDWLDGSKLASNGIYKMTEAQLQEYIAKYPWIEPFLYVQTSGSQLKVQIKWPEPEISAVSYNSFYMGLFSVVYGQENAEYLNPNPSGDLEFSRAHGVGDYLKGTDLYTETNGYFAALTADPLQPQETLEIWSGYGIDGPAMGNSYQNYEFTYYNTITLEQVDTSYTVRHDYYTDGELDGSVTLDPVSGMVGDAIDVTTIAQVPQYDDNTYTYTSTTPEASLVLGKNADQNVIVLRYDRTNSSHTTYYTLTVRYLEEGTDQVLAAPYSVSKAALTYYNVTDYTDLAIEGYTISQVTGDPVTGSMNGNKEIIVYYTADEDLTDPETPLNPDPGDGTDIGDGEVPLNPDPGTDVPDTDVPTTDIPETGDSMGLWLALAALSAGGLAVLTLSERRKKA